MTSLLERFESSPHLQNVARSSLAKYAAPTAPAEAATRAAGSIVGVGERAGWKPVMRDVAVFAAGSAAAAAVTGELMGGYGRLKGAIFKQHNFNKMMKENPDLEQLDKRQLQLAFNTINRFNPEFASDPMIAGTWTRQIAGYGEGVPVDRAAQLVQATGNLAKLRALEGKSNPFINTMSSLSEGEQNGIRNAKEEEQNAARLKLLDAQLQRELAQMESGRGGGGKSPSPRDLFPGIPR